MEHAKAFCLLTRPICLAESGLGGGLLGRNLLGGRFSQSKPVSEADYPGEMASVPL
jgi:hypothetical protein